MKRYGLFSLLNLVGMATLLIPPAGAQVNYGAHMYLSVAPDHYDCGIAEPLWDTGVKDIYVVVDNSSPNPGEAFNGAEYGLDYPLSLFLITTDAPQSPGPLIVGNYVSGRIDLAMGSGGPVEENPWLAIRHEFLNFGAGENLVFTLDMNRINHSSRLGENPGYALFDPLDPPLFAASREGVGSGADHKPDWRAGVVLLNYNPATLDPAVEADLAERVQDPGHPLWMAAVPANAETWGQLKAKY